MEGDAEAVSPSETLHFQGDLVRLTAWDPEADAEVFAGWHNNPMSARLAGWRPVLPLNTTSAKEKLEEWVKAPPGSFYFAVRTVADDRLVGGVSLKGVSLIDEVAELGVSIFQPEDWGKGFGKEAVLLGLSYAFDELGLHRVWLTVSSFNERAIKLYEKLGFRQEGRARDHIRLDGRRWDVLYMGLLRDEFTR